MTLGDGRPLRSGRYTNFSDTTAAAFGLVPTLSTHGLPFLGYCHPITVPLLEVPAFLIALFCDQLSAEIAEDEELAEKGTIVLRVADQEEGGE